MPGPCVARRRRRGLRLEAAGRRRVEPVDVGAHGGFEAVAVPDVDAHRNAVELALPTEHGVRAEVSGVVERSSGGVACAGPQCRAERCDGTDPRGPEETAEPECAVAAHRVAGERQAPGVEPVLLEHRHELVEDHRAGVVPVRPTVPVAVAAVDPGHGEGRPAVRDVSCEEPVVPESVAEEGPVGAAVAVQGDRDRQRPGRLGRRDRPADGAAAAGLRHERAGGGRDGRDVGDLAGLPVQPERAVHRRASR